MTVDLRISIISNEPTNNLPHSTSDTNFRHDSITNVTNTFQPAIMRAFGLLTAALAIVPGVLAKSAIVYFEDKNTPESVIEDAKNDIIKNGGTITHHYSIIKCVAPRP